MRLLALDQSSRVSGYAIFIDDKLETYGKIELKQDDVGERLVEFRKRVISLIIDYDIDEVAFEDIYMDGHKVDNVSTFKVLAEVFGICDELFTEMEIKNTAVLAGTWKSTLGIKGKTRPEQKRSAQAYVKNKYNIDVIQDIVDAICIGEHIIQKKNSMFDWS